MRGALAEGGGGYTFPKWTRTPGHLPNFRENDTSIPPCPHPMGPYKILTRACQSLARGSTVLCVFVYSRERLSGSRDQSGGTPLAPTVVTAVHGWPSMPPPGRSLNGIFGAAIERTPGRRKMNAGTDDGSLPRSREARFEPRLPRNLPGEVTEGPLHAAMSNCT